MSLLMDALKRAEESKQEAAKDLGGSGPERLALEPLENVPEPVPPIVLPNLADHLANVDADLATNAPLPPTPGVPPRTLAGPVTPAASSKPFTAPAKAPPPKPETVRNVFAAKEVPPSSRGALWLTLGVLGVAAMGIAGYVWYQMHDMGRSSLTLAPTPPQSATAPPAPRPATPSVALPPATTMPQVLPSEPATTIAERAAPSRLLSAPRKPEAVARVPDPSRAETAAPAIHLVRSRPEVDANLARGYQSLQAGNFEVARQDYEQALRRDPKNVDALLGAAAIAKREGRAADAERYSQQAFDADPKDAAAQAAMVGMAAGADPVAAESRLKTLLSSQPESGPLNFALGNLYSRQSRWAEAQQMYFNAVAADGDNPDYLFNLAVSLDRLRQPKLAAQHYRLALDAAGRRAAAFDGASAKKRLDALLP